MTDEAAAPTFAAAPTHPWYRACRSNDLGSQPVAVTLNGTDIVLFRDDGHAAHALLDRCAHREVPLSQGRVDNGCLQCSFHGWRFDGSGHQVKIPGFESDPMIETINDPIRDPEDPRDAALAALAAALAAARPRSVPTYATKEEDGAVWVSWSPPARHGDDLVEP